MGYRGEDASRAAWGRQTPGRSAGNGTDDAEQWDDGPRGYPQDDHYRGPGQPGYGQYEPYEDYGYRPEDRSPDYGGRPDPGYGDPEYRDPQYADPGYRDRRDQGGYQEPRGGYGRSGGYPAQRTGSGGHLALPAGSGGYSAPDAGNDWYGGQPAAANGASFADTGTYKLNGRIIDEYGTGPRRAMNTPGGGYPPSRDYPPQDYPPQLPAGPAGHGGRGAVDGGYRGPGNGPRDDYDEYDDYDARADAAPGGSYGAAGYDDYDAEPARYGTGPGRAVERRDRDAYDDYDDYGQDSFGQDAYDDYADDDDPYQDQYGDTSKARRSKDGAAGRGGKGSKRPKGTKQAERAERFDNAPKTGNARRNGAPGRPNQAGRPRGKRSLLLAVVAVIAVGVIGAAAYVFVFKHAPANNASADTPLPSASAVPSTQACVQQFGTYCHIETRVDDPAPLTLTELYPPAFTNETDKISYSLVASKLDKTCSTAVIGATLISQLKAGQCTQVARASYVSGDGKIMGTIGVVNLATTVGAHHAGRVVGQSDFVTPLKSAKGVASKIGNGTGVVEAEYKGHYLILTWSEFVNGAHPSTTAQDSQLEKFANDLIAGTANISLSQRMVTGAPPSAGAAG
jgi:hypothetical protein